MSELVRVGKVSSIDYPSGMVRVVYTDKNESVTRLIPLLSESYEMPEVDEMVLVVHLSNGGEAGFVLGRPWSTVNVPPEGEQGLYRKDFDLEIGVAMLRYLDQLMQLVCPTVEVTGDVNIIGNLAVTGNITATGTITSDTDVIAQGVSLKNHTHTSAGAGGQSSEPN